LATRGIAVCAVVAAIGIVTALVRGDDHADTA
jgi:hypothetical protein